MQLNLKQYNNHSKINEAISISMLEEALNYINDACGENGIKRMVILKNGQTIFKGAESSVVQPVWSCTKSFTSTILGLLIAENKCKLDDKVCIYLPELKKYYPEVTFKHFATMTSGYRAIGDEPRGSYVHGPSKTPHIPSPEYLFEPGSEFRYWDSAMNMFAYALSKIAGEPLEKYFKSKIAEPIGMDDKYWDWNSYSVNGNIINGGAGNNQWGISISAEKFAKFGQLMLQNGNYNGQQLLSKKWIKAATSPQVKNLIPDNNTPYGFNWWTSEIYPDAPEGTFAAKGFNNNKCIIIPKYNLVIVRLGLDGNIDDKEWNNFIKILTSNL